MQVLLTGGTGFIGGHLARLLASRGHRVRALVREGSKRAALEEVGASFAVGDLCSGEGLEQALEGVQWVLHLAGATRAKSEEEYFRCNAEGTRKLAEAMSQMPSPARLVYCSSLAAAGPSCQKLPRKEEDLCRPVSAYGRSKLGGELAVRQYSEQVPSVIVRPPVVYGPGDRAFLPSLLPLARRGVFLKSGFGPRRYALLHVEDLCEGLYLAAAKGRRCSGDTADHGVYFLTDGEEGHLWEEVCRALGEAAGARRSWVIPLPGAVSWAAGLGAELYGRLKGALPVLSRDKAAEIRQGAWTCSCDRARRELGYTPRVSLREGFKQTLEWYRKEGCP